MKNILFCILAMLAACNKEKSKNEVVDTQIDIFIENNAGNNLLVATTPGAINPDSIKLIYLINGENFTVYNIDMDCPRAVCSITDAGSERIRIFPNDVESQEFPITYVVWDNGDVDTLKCHFVRKDNGATVICDKVWLNDLPMFPDHAISGFGRAFKIVK